MFDNLPTRGELPSPSQIILWWEGRRALYNTAVGAVGFVSVAILLTIGRKVIGDQEPLLSPFLLFLGILAYAVAANICYTAAGRLSWSCADGEAAIQRSLPKQPSSRAWAFLV